MTTSNVSETATKRGQLIQVNNLQLYYEEYGVGEPMVLLHGFGGSTQNWYPFIPEFAKHYRLIVVDLRGHGYSTNPENKFTHREAANDVLLLLEKLGIERFSAMGISSGGMTLLHMATSQPMRIKSMVLISATYYFPEQARVIMRRASYGTMPIPVQKMYRECAKFGEAQIHKLIGQFNALHDNYDDMNFTPQHLSVISARTLVIHGDRDRFFPVEIPENICRSIPDAELWIIPGGDHVPIYDSSIPFVSTVVQFFNRSSIGNRVE